MEQPTTPVRHRETTLRITAQLRRNLGETLSDLHDPRVIRRQRELLRGQLGGAGHGPRFEAALTVAAIARLNHSRAAQKSSVTFVAARAAHWRGDVAPDVNPEVLRARRNEEAALRERTRSEGRLVKLARCDFRRRLSRPWAPRRVRPVRRAVRFARARARRSHRVARPLDTVSGDSGDDGGPEPPGNRRRLTTEVAS